MPVETEFAGRFELAQEDVERRESMSQADHAHVEECTQSCLEHKTDRRHSKANWSLMPKIMETIIEAKGGRQIIES